MRGNVRSGIKRAVCLLLCAVMLILSACGNQNEQKQTETDLVQTETKPETAATIAATAHITEPVTEAETEEEEMKWEGYHVKSLTVGGIDISDYVIVRQEKNATMDNAVGDLIEYVKKATGVELKDSDGSEKKQFEICVGQTDRDTEKVKTEREKLYNDGYAIIFDKGRLYLTGKTVTGTMYAVYGFLEDNIGWRFYSSTCEDVKFAKHIDIPSDICVTFSPKLMNRDTFWYDTFN